MKSFIVLALFVAVAVAVPADPKYVETLRYENDNIGVGAYRYAVETSDGTVQEQSGQLQNAGKENEGIAVQGSYKFVAPDGVTYLVTYTADENGFKPQGAHLPQAPTY